MVTAPRGRALLEYAECTLPRGVSTPISMLMLSKRVEYPKISEVACHSQVPENAPEAIYESQKKCKNFLEQHVLFQADT